MGQRHPGPSRAPPHRRGGGHHRTAGTGFRQRCRHGHRRALAAGPVLPRGVRPPHVRGGRRRVPGGGHLPRGRVPGRTPRTRPPGLRLRRQPHHHRRTHRTGPGRRPGRAVRRLRVGGRRHRRGGQRPRRPRGRSPARPGRRGASLADHPAQPHRVPGAGPDRHVQGTRRSVQRRGGGEDQGDPRAPRRPDVLGARRRARHVPVSRAPGSRPARRVGGAPRRLGRRPWAVRRGPGRSRRTRMGGAPADVRPDRRPDGHPQGDQGRARRHPGRAARAHAG